MALYEIADLSNVWVVASVHERDLNTLRVGMTARFTTTNGQMESLTARVDLVEPLLEESTRTTRVRLVVPNREDVSAPASSVRSSSSCRLHPVCSFRATP
jgi:Cu(I)/Ag(I) efflux system membrane fusion protein